VFKPRGRVSWTDPGIFVSVRGAPSWRAETLQGPVLEDLYEGQDGVAVLPATGQINPGRQCVTPLTPEKPQKGSSHRIEPLRGWVLTGVLPSGQR
jgi:hypothetical protein